MDIMLPNMFANKDVKIIRIKKKAGEKVKKGEAVFEVEGSKGATGINSDLDGVISSINVAEGDTVNSSIVLASVKEDEKINCEKKEVAFNFNYFGNLVKPIEEKAECDILIIGGGPGGYVAAIYAAKLGAKVILIEKDKLGGTCLNWGCIPTKCFVRSSEVYKEIAQAEKYGCFAENMHVDMKKVKERKDDVVKNLNTGVSYLLKKNAVRVISGSAEFLENKRVFVKENNTNITIDAKNVIVATGSKIGKLNIKGIDFEGVLNSDSALALDYLPDKITIVGGGVIGMEFAFIFRNFGKEVSVVEYLDRILFNCDSDISNECHKIAKEKGINIYTCSKVEEIIKSEDGKLIVEFSKDGEKKYISSDRVLFAVGRIPNIEGLSIDKTDVELNEKGRGIKVNSKMQTNVPNIYAIGDVTNIMQLAHVASHQGIVAVKNIMGIECDMDYETVPAAIFTDPEIAMVGVTEDIAKAKGLEYEAFKFPLSANGKALSFGDGRGFIKLIVEKNTKKILGAGILGVHATDLISELTLAINKGLTIYDIEDTIHPHPTTSEIIPEAAMFFDKGAIHYAE